MSTTHRDIGSAHGTDFLNSSSSSVVPTTPVVSSSAPASTPLMPSGAGATGSSPAAPSGSPAASQPAFNAGAMNAATGAGAGLAAVFGAVALLL